MKEAHHQTIMGLTGGGKTYYAGYLFSQTKGLKVFYNTQNTDYIRKLGTNIDSVFEIEDLEASSIVINSGSFSEEDIAQDMQFIHQWAFERGQLLDGKYWLDIYFDEAHLLSSTTKRDENLDAFWTQGRGHGICATAITQRPALISKTIVSQSERYICFDVTAYDKKYLRNYGIDLEPYEEWLSHKYNYVIIEGNRITEGKKIKEYV